jgi:amino acid transporter
MEKQEVFVRKATGLVRHVGLLDAVLLNIESNTFGLSLIYYALIVGVFPGDPLLAAALAALGCVPVAIAYASMSTAMPRSGGDYVFISRVLHPALAVAASISISAWFFFWTGAYANWVLSVGASASLQALGSIFNIPELLGASQLCMEIPVLLIFGSIIILSLCLIAARSNILAFKLLDVMVILGIIGVFLWTVSLGMMNRASFIDRFNAYAAQYVNDPDYYHTILKTAAEAGYNPNYIPTWVGTLFMIPFATYIFPYLAAQSCVGGEVKDPGKSFFAGLLLNLLISAIMVVAAMWALINAVGLDFLSAINYVYVNGLGYYLPTPPYFTLFAGLAAPNIILQIIMMVGFICWSLAIPLINCIQVPRWLFAMAMDRVLPEKLTSVSRWATPWVGVLVMAIGSEICLIVYTLYASVLATISAVFANILATFMVACIAAIFLPFRKRTKVIFETAPRLASLKIAGFPVMSLAGILGAGFLGWVSYMYAVYPEYGANNLPSIMAVVGIYIIGLLIYFIAKVYNARRGLDISLAFKEIPPA